MSLKKINNLKINKSFIKVIAVSSEDKFQDIP